MLQTGASQPRQNSRATTAEHSCPSRYSVSPTLTYRALALLVPSGSYREMVAIFGGRAPRQTVKDWRRGYSRPPQWALDMLLARLSPYVEMLRILEQTAPGPGKRAGARNIMEWRANRYQRQAAARGEAVEPKPSDPAKP